MLALLEVFKGERTNWVCENKNLSKWVLDE
jgi:hypothetical protein